MQMLIEIVSHTPLWVWGVLAIVLYLGASRTRDRVVAFWQLLPLPTIMTALAVLTLAGAGLGALPVIAVGLAAGGVAGWLLEGEGATRRLPDGRVWIRGEWISLVQIIAISTLRYTNGAVTAMNPGLAATPSWHAGTALASALLAAIFVARTAARLRACFVTPLLAS